MRAASRSSGALGQNGISLTVVPRTARARPAIWNPGLTWCTRMVGYSTRNDVLTGNRFVLSGQRIKQREAGEKGDSIRKWRELEHGSLPQEEASDPRWSQRRPGRTELAACMPRGHDNDGAAIDFSMRVWFRRHRGAQEGKPMLSRLGKRVAQSHAVAGLVADLVGLCRLQVRAAGMNGARGWRINSTSMAL
jgi:hypothetical protein